MVACSTAWDKKEQSTWSEVTHYYKIAAFSALPANDPGMRATWDYVGTGVVRPAHRYRGLDDEDHDGPGVEEFVQQQRQRGHSPAESNR